MRFVWPESSDAVQMQRGHVPGVQTRFSRSGVNTASVGLWGRTGTGLGPADVISGRIRDRIRDEMAKCGPAPGAYHVTVLILELPSSRYSESLTKRGRGEK